MMVIAGTVGGLAHCPLLLAASTCFTVCEVFDPPPCAFGLENGPGVMSISPMSGWIAGFTTDCAEAYPEAMVWSSATGFVTIPIPAQYDKSQAMDVNDSGTAVGWMAPFNPETPKGFVYIQSIFIPVLPTPPMNHLELRGVNNANVAVGWHAKISFPDPIPNQAIRWVAGVIDQLKLPLPGHSVAEDINDSGAIAGFMASGTASLIGRGFIWTEDRVVTLEPLPGWSNSEARSLNNHGDAAGHCRQLPWDPKLGYTPKRATLWIDAKPIDLGVLPGGWQSSIATDINDQRQVIGFCTDNPSAANRYFLWQDGVMHDLAPLVQFPDEIVAFGGVSAINNLGQMASGGVHTKSEMGGVGFILNPASPADLSGDCIVNGIDLAELLGDWGRCPRNETCPADLDGNGVINGFDLAMLLAAWG